METISQTKLVDQSNYPQWSEEIQRSAARGGFLSLIRDRRYANLRPPTAMDNLVYKPVKINHQSDQDHQGFSLIDDPAKNENFELDEVESRLMQEQKWHEYALIKERLLSASQFIVASLTNIVALRLLYGRINYYNPYGIWMSLKKRYGKTPGEAIDQIIQAANNLILADCSSMLEYLNRQSEFTAKQMEIMTNGVPSSVIAGRVLHGLTPEYVEIIEAWRPRLESQKYDNINNPVALLYDVLLKKENELSCADEKATTKEGEERLPCQ